MSDEQELLAKARAKRRAVLGAEYVDGQLAEPNPTLAEFQDYLTTVAWSPWAREGVLSTRDRSLLVLAITAALGRMEEFALHASARTRAGVTDAEIDELLFQVVAYAGAPAGVSAKRALAKVRAAERSAAEPGTAEQ
jgi:4-carboxymuconolactone decarboxylase